MNDYLTNTFILKNGDGLHPLNPEQTAAWAREIVDLRRNLETTRAEATAREATAACAAMRALLDRVASEVVGALNVEENQQTGDCPANHHLVEVLKGNLVDAGVMLEPVLIDKYEGDWVYVPLLPTTVGAGWVSPEEHARVVGERDAEIERLASACDGVLTELQKLKDYKSPMDPWEECAFSMGEWFDKDIIAKMDEARAAIEAARLKAKSGEG